MTTPVTVRPWEATRCREKHGRKVLGGALWGQPTPQEGVPGTPTSGSRRAPLCSPRPGHRASEPRGAHSCAQTAGLQKGGRVLDSCSPSPSREGAAKAAPGPAAAETWLWDRRPGRGECWGRPPQGPGSGGAGHPTAGEAACRCGVEGPVGPRTWQWRPAHRRWLWPRGILPAAHLWPVPSPLATGTSAYCTFPVPQDPDPNPHPGDCLPHPPFLPAPPPHGDSSCSQTHPATARAAHP